MPDEKPLPMLRDFMYEGDIYQLRDLFLEFKAEESGSWDGAVALVWFKVITPDSFAWKVLHGPHIYLIYAEDYVPSLDHVKEQMRWLNEGHGFELLEVHDAVQFEKASPVRHASKYTRPVKADELMKYALPSGYDFVFLARSDEPVEDAFFNEEG